MKTTKSIWIEWRAPADSFEKTLYGSTRYDNTAMAKIFINERLARKRNKLAETFWHEMVHVFCHFHNMRLSRAEEEKLSQKLSRIIVEVLK